MVAIDFPKEHEDILHDDEHPQTNRIVALGIDNSEHSEYALKWAAENILRSDTDLVVLLNVRTIKGNDTDLSFLNPLTGKIEQEHRKHSHSILKNAASILKSKNFAIKAISLRGDARDEITRKVEELNTDMLIIGSRGMNGLSRALIGSTSDYLIHHVHCPVLVVRKD